MYFITLLLLLGIAQQSFAGGNKNKCSAQIAITPQSGQWLYEGTQQRIYDITVTNDAESCSFENLDVAIHNGPGTFVESTWGYTWSSGLLHTPRLTPGSSHSGAGFILSGHGHPRAEINDYIGCQCDQEDSSSDNTPPTPKPTEAPGELPTVPFIKVDLKYAIFACDGTLDRDPALLPAIKAVQSVGSVFDIYFATNTSSLTLVNEDGSGKYAGLIFTNQIYSVDNCWASLVTDVILPYERDFKVKTVILNSNAYADSGVQCTFPSGYYFNDSQIYATFSAEFAKNVPMYKSGIQMPIPMSGGVYGCPATILASPPRASKAIVATIDGTEYVLAALINYADDGSNRRRLEFYFGQGDWSHVFSLISGAWFNWLSNGVFAGMRRIELNAHMDDVFMSTGMFDINAKDGPGEGTKETYRITAKDLQFISDWQTNLTNHMTPGSKYVLTMPYNAFSVVNPAEGNGYDKDPLFAKAKELRDRFFWETHTWSHQYLTNFSYLQTMDELEKNVPGAMKLYDNNLDNPSWCKSSMITPSISGLLNADAIKAMLDFGIKYVVGDNSLPHLYVNHTNKYHGLYTNQIEEGDFNGHEGLYVVPRHATNIYYDASQPKDIEAQFNWLYSVKLGKTFTFAEIVERDVEAALQALLAYRHDPFMFHQANMRQFSLNGRKTSLIGYWSEGVIEGLLKYTSLPITSHSHDVLAESFLAREERDNCGFQGQLWIDQSTTFGDILGLSATTSNSCKYAISGAVSANNDKFPNEEVGPEKTFYIPFTGGQPYNIMFKTPVAQS
jgi:hypothetical protein